MLDGLRLAVGTLTVLPVTVRSADARTAGSAMTWAPAVGAVLGALAGGAAWLAAALDLGSLTAAVAALATIAVLTRGLHLDGLADTADGLGSGRSSHDALCVMRAADIGPFGVVTLILVLLAQVAALAQLGPGEAAASLVVAVATGRLALTWACRRGVPAARTTGLGALVAGTVAPTQLAAITGATLVAAAAVSVLRGGGAPHGVLAVIAGVAAALALLAHCRRRLGGVTGDVLGALVETATTSALLVLAIG